MYDRQKSTIQYGPHTLSCDVSVENGLTIDEMRDFMLIPLLYALGYQPENVRGLFYDEDIDG